MADEINRLRRREVLGQLAAYGVLGTQLSKTALSAIVESPRSRANLMSELTQQGISVILPGDPGYDTARLVWDRRVDKKPAAILGCASVAHIQEALRFCEKERLPVAIRGGGHGFPGRSTIDGGALIDLAGMYEVKLDVINRTVTVGPGVRTGYLLGITTPKGLAPVTTTDNHIGAIGAALFAGQGYLSPLYGNMCDNVLQLEVVLADGRLITVSAEQHPDLFWAMRGAGDNFGVVTSMTMRLYSIPPTVHSCYFEYDAVHHGKQVMQFFRDRQWESPLPFLLGTLVPDVATNEPRVGYLFALIGNEQQTTRDLAAVDQLASTAKRRVEKMSWLELHTQLGLPPDNRWYITQRDMHGLDDEAIDMLLEEIRAVSADPLAPKPIDNSPGAVIFFYPTDAAMGRQADPPNAYSLRGGYDLEALAMYKDPAMDEHHRKWSNGVLDRFHKAGKTIKASVIANSTVDARVTRESFGHDYERLVELKREYDPHNVFQSTSPIIRA